MSFYRWGFLSKEHINQRPSSEGSVSAVNKQIPSTPFGFLYELVTVATQ
jgi:hypothetical protein